MRSCGCQSAAAPQQQQPVFRAGADTVRVFVTVTDREGRLVTDLTQDKFEIRDEGKPQPITMFDNSPKPIALIVMLDVSAAWRAISDCSAQVRASSSRALAPKTSRVSAPSSKTSSSVLNGRNARALESALPVEIDPHAPTPLWRAVDDAMKGFDAASDRRKVVLVLSDGQDGRTQPASDSSVRPKWCSPRNGKT